MIKVNLRKALALTSTFMYILAGSHAAVRAEEMECEPISYSVDYEVSQEYLDVLNYVINHDACEEPTDYAYFWANWALGKKMGACQKNIAVKIKNKEVITVDDIYPIEELCESKVAKEIFANAKEGLAQIYNAAFTNNKLNDYSGIALAISNVASYIESKEGLLSKGEIWALNNAAYRIISEVSTLVVDYMNNADKAIVFKIFDNDTYLAKGILVAAEGVNTDIIARLKNEGCLCPIKAFIAEVLEAKDMIERMNQRLGIGICDFSGKSIIERRQELFAMGLIDSEEDKVRRRG